MKNTKGLIAISLFLFTALAVLFTRNTVFAVADKVTICHATSAETNAYVRTVVSINAIGGHFDNPGTPKAGHEDDLLLAGDVPCPGDVQTTPTITNTPTPTPTLPIECDGECFPQATPTPTPGGDVIIGNIDPCFRRVCPTATPTPTVIPTATPTEVPGPTATPAPGTGGGSSNGGSSSSAGSSNGSVQGASTAVTTALAATGVFTETLMNMVGLAGVMLTGLSAVRYGKKS